MFELAQRMKMPERAAAAAAAAAAASEAMPRPPVDRSRRRRAAVGTPSCGQSSPDWLSGISGGCSSCGFFLSYRTRISL